VEKELFTAALGIEEPLYIEEIVFDRAEGELHIHMNFRRGGRFCCSECGAEDLPVHDTVEKTWRHLNFWQYKTYIHLRTPRTKCKNCGDRLWIPPWGRKQSGFTMLFEAVVMTLAKEMPISKIGEIVGETDTRIWRIVRGHVCRAYARKAFGAVKKLGVDETSSRKGHNYVTVFADMDSGDVLFATQGKDGNTIKEFAKEMPAHSADAQEVQEVTMDMSPAFISGAADHLPNASITFDKFHIIQALNKAQDEVRRMEQKQNPLLKRSRYIWLKNPENLSAEQKKKLESLRFENLKTAKVYQMKLTFQDIYRNIREPEAAEEAIKKWLSWAVRSRIDPIKKFAKTVKTHWNGILRYFHSRLTSGAMEGINSRIQEIKRRARGFRNINNFIAMIYLEAAGLDFALPT
jgi:Transposase and inactivated derivatives